MSSVDLIGTTTGLTCFALAVETWGTSRQGERFWSNDPRQYVLGRLKKVAVWKPGGDHEGQAPTEALLERGGESEVSTLADVGPGGDSVPAYWCG